MRQYGPDGLLSTLVFALLAQGCAGTGKIGARDRDTAATPSAGSTDPATPTDTVPTSGGSTPPRDTGTTGGTTRVETADTGSPTPPSTTDTDTSPEPPTVHSVEIVQPDIPDWELTLSFEVSPTTDRVGVRSPDLGVDEVVVVLDGAAAVALPVDPCEEGPLGTEVRMGLTPHNALVAGAVFEEVIPLHGAVAPGVIELGDTFDVSSSVGEVPEASGGPRALCADIHSTGHTAWITGDLDWYIFSLPETGDVQIDLAWDNPSTDLDLRLLDWDTHVLAASERRSGTAEQVLFEDLPAGPAYRFWVGGWDGPVDDYVVTLRMLP